MRPSSVLAITSLTLCTSMACGALRQNLRSQFVSYRGAWSCTAAGCAAGDVEKSKAGRTEGDLRINAVKLAPLAGLVFYPGVPVESMTAKVRDCKGKSKEVPSAKVHGPGRHKIPGEGDSWVIWLDDSVVGDLEVGSGDCAVLVVTTHSTWDDGSVYDAEGAVEIEG